MADTQEYPVEFICHHCDFRSRKLLDVELHGHRGYVEAVVVLPHQPVQSVTVSGSDNKVSDWARRRGF